MSNDELRSAIDLAIKSNGAREITGPILNDILNDVVDTYELRDVTIFNQDATPVATNTGDLWYAPTAEQFSIWDGAVWDEMFISATKLYQPDGTNPFVYTDNAGVLHVDGDIVQEGTSYETHLEQVYTKDDLIITRDGAVSGLTPITGFTGIQATKYDGTNDGQLVFDWEGWARVGDVGSLQKLATIEETSNDNGIAFYDLATLQLQTNSDFVFNGTNVGIGTDTPFTKLVTSGAFASSVPALGVGTDAIAAITEPDGDWGLITGLLNDGTAWMQAKRLDGTATAYNLLLNPLGGNVGIGTDSPTTSLHIETTNAAGILIDIDGTNSSLQVRNSVDDVYFGINTSGNAVIGHSADQTSSPLQIKSDGSVGINNSSPSAKLHIKANGTTTGVSFRIDNSSSVTTFKILDRGTLQSIGTYNLTSASAANINIDSGGNFFRSTSSKVLKENITYDIDPKLALSLKPTPFTEISTGNQQLGFIAEDSDEVDSRFATNQDEEGMMGIDTTAMLAATLSTVQAQEKRIIMLEVENVALRTRLGAIEAKLNK